MLLCASALACDAPARRLGDFCSNDYECGKGAACYERRCTKLCAPGEACPEGTRCQDYRCLPTGSEVGAVERDEEAPIDAPLPAPEPIEAELRAIRVELETIRRQNEEILEKLGD